MCMPSTVAQIFIVSGALHIKHLVGKFKQRTNVPYPYHYKTGVSYQRTIPVRLQKRRTLSPYCTANLGLQCFKTTGALSTKDAVTRSKQSLLRAAVYA